MPVAWILLLGGCLIDRALYEQRLAELQEEGTVSNDGTGDSGSDDTSSTDTDADGDGYPWGDDCDDGDPDVHSGAAETCNGVDDDCDGEIDDSLEEHTWFADSDHDGWGNSYITYTGCAAPESFVDVDRDCDDADATVNPDAVDVIDSVDNDCDDMVDVEGMRNLGPAWLGATAFGHAGSAMAVGDLDGDGSDDLVVAGLGDSTWPDSEAFVSVLMSAVSEGGSLATADVTVTADYATGFGAEIAAIEGTDSAVVAVGAPYADWSGSPGGAVYLFDVSTSPTVAPGDGSVIWSSASSTFGFGGTVQEVGDWDGDGLTDIAIGDAVREVDSHRGAGALYVLPAPFEAGDAEDLAVASIYGDGDKVRLGEAGIGGQDLNEDGYDDLVCAAPYVGTEVTNGGEVYLFHGGGTGGTASDADATVIGDDEEGTLGVGLAMLDDVDEDGRAEVVLGETWTSGAAGGRLLIYQGDLQGTMKINDASFVAWSAQPAAHLGAFVGPSIGARRMVVGNPTSEAAGSSGVHLVKIGVGDAEMAQQGDFVHGDLEGDEAGTSVIAVGGTLFIGAPGADDGASGAGGVWMVPIPTDR